MEILDRQRLVKAKRAPQLLDVGLASRGPGKQHRHWVAGQIPQAPHDRAHRPEGEYGEHQTAADVPPHSQFLPAGGLKARDAYPVMLAYCNSIRSNGLGFHWSFLFAP